MIISVLLVRSHDTSVAVSENRMLDEIAPSGDLEKVEITDHTVARLYIRRDSLDKPQYHDVFRPYLLKARGPHYKVLLSSEKQVLAKLAGIEKQLPNGSGFGVKELHRPGDWRQLTGWTLISLLVIVAITAVLNRRKRYGRDAKRHVTGRFPWPYSFIREARFRITRRRMTGGTA